jgi:hypothetical protein
MSGFKTDGLSIFKRDADCYDITSDGGRVAALRAEFTEDAAGERTATPGTWRIRWENRTTDGLRSFAHDVPPAVEALRFGTVHEAFAFYCGQVLL